MYLICVEGGVSEGRMIGLFLVSRIGVVRYLYLREG